MIINVIVTDKIARAEKHEPLVCGNSDYLIEFSFDAEWDEYQTKTARFIFDDRSYADVVFTGTQCRVPVLKNTHDVIVGVFAGNLRTTTPAYLRAQRSILCGGGVPADPDPDVYAQIMELLHNTTGSGDKLDKDQGANNAGRLLYVSDSGMVLPLVLGNGLQIVDGVLTITNLQAVRAICGTVTVGQTKCGEV